MNGDALLDLTSRQLEELGVCEAKDQAVFLDQLDALRCGARDG